MTSSGDPSSPQAASGWQPGSTPGGGWVPVPDPTKLTTEQLRRELDQATTEIRREIESARLLLATRFDSHIRESDGRFDTVDRRLTEVPGARDAAMKALHELIESRLAALESKLRLNFEEVRTIPDQTRAEIAHLRELHEERFGGIELQFKERDVRAEQEKKASKEALDAALLAQKESVSQQNDANTTAATKSETSFTKQIDLVTTAIAALDKSWADRFTELKERIDRGEGTSTGAGAQRAENRLERGAGTSQAMAIIMAVSAVLAVAAIIVSIALRK